MSASVAAALMRAHGGPEVLEVGRATLPDPGPGEARVRNAAVALNFCDVYERRGLYPVALPVVPGSESAGTVEALGEGVRDLEAGDRVAVLTGPGNYAEAMNAPADRLVRLPPGVDERTAAAAATKAMTAEFLLERCAPVRRGQTILFHAAAGGVGLIACQWAKALGARVIGTVSTPAKAALAAAHGCDLPLLRGEDWVGRVREETGGEGVPVVYDSVGADTFEGSLDCLARRGVLVSFGQSSGEPAPFGPLLLARKGSVFVTRPTLDDYAATRRELLASAERAFATIAEGKVKVSIGQTFRLAEIAEAHRALESGRTTGSTVILP